MKTSVVVCGAVFSVCIMISSAYAQGASFSTGAKVVLANWDQEGDWGTTSGSGTLIGPMLAVDFQNSYWLSALCLSGTIDFDERSEPSENEFLAGELFAGRSFRWCDVGAGLRYWRDDQPDNPAEKSEWTHYGPAIYIGVSEPINTSPVGWYATGSLMFVDIGDGDGEHYRAEVGLWAALGDFSLLAGYRIMNAYAPEGMDKLDIHGATIGLTYTFSR
jgi:hypothetical protein